VDHVVLYSAPDEAQRRSLLEHFSSDLTFAFTAQLGAELTDGLTPAQIKEAIKQAAVSSLGRGQPEAWDRLLREEEFRESVTAVRCSALARVKRPIGVRP
jgi:SpoVK/Ycf46/Vps4 family AAA+-type ATPase